jgi:hypothetical protein
MGAKYDGTRHLHDTLVNEASRSMSHAKVPHMGGVDGSRRTCKGLFAEQLNSLQSESDTGRFIQGIIPDHMIDATSLQLSEHATNTFGPCTLCDWKTLGPGQAYSESAATDYAGSVKKRQEKVSKDYHTSAKRLDETLGTASGTIGPVETELNGYNSGNVAGLVTGAYGEMSGAVHDLADLIATELAADHLQFFDIDPKACKSMFLQQVRRSWGLAAHRGWAKLLLDRTRDLVEHPNQPRDTRTTNRDAAEAYMQHHDTNPPGRNNGFAQRN